MIFQFLWKKWKVELAEPCTDRFNDRGKNIFIDDEYNNVRPGEDNYLGLSK